MGADEASGPRDEDELTTAYCELRWNKDFAWDLLWLQRHDI